MYFQNPLNANFEDFFTENFETVDSVEIKMFLWRFAYAPVRGQILIIPLQPANLFTARRKSETTSKALLYQIFPTVRWSSSSNASSTHVVVGVNVNSKIDEIIYDFQLSTVIWEIRRECADWLVNNKYFSLFSCLTRPIDTNIIGMH